MSASQPAARRPDELPDAERPPQSSPEPLPASFDRSAKIDWGDDRAPIPLGAPVVVTRDAPPDVPAAPPFAPPVVSALPTPVTEAEKRKVSRVLRASTFRWMSILGVAGFAIGAVCGGWYASRMGYDARLSSLIGVLIGTAIGRAGMMIPPLFRAIGWGVLAAAMGGVGGGALWILTKVAPALVERILH